MPAFGMSHPTVGSRLHPWTGGQLEDMWAGSLMESVRRARVGEGSLKPRAIEGPFAAWSTRGALLLLGRTPQVGEVVVKWDRHDRPEVVRAGFAAHRRLTDLLNGSAMGTAEPLGWTASPACLITRYVPGTDLDQFVGERGVSAEAIRALRGCGAALAHYHTKVGVTSGSLTVSERSQVAARRSRTGRRSRLSAGTTLVLSAHDFAVNNVRVAEDGGLVWLDPPLRHVLTVREHDVAKFLVVLYRNSVLGRRDTAISTLPIAATRQLESAFLTGYAESHGQPLDQHLLLDCSSSLLKQLTKKDVVRGAWRWAGRTALWSGRSRLAAWAYPAAQRLRALGR